MKNKNICTLEYLAKQIEIGVKDNKINQGERPVSSKCYVCTTETRCNFYMPLIRIQNIKKGNLYRRNYNQIKLEREK